MVLIVWVLGPTGVGKSLLSEGLRALLGCDVIQTGALIRNTYPTKRISQFDIPDTEIFELIKTQIINPATNLIIVDNYPINKPQLDSWYRVFTPPQIVLNLKATEEVLTSRRTERGRFDDNEIHISFRTHQYNYDTIPVITYMEDQTSVYSLDGSTTPRKVLAAAYKHIRNKFIELKDTYKDSTVLNIERYSNTSRIPTKAYPFSAGFDIYLETSIIIPPHKTETHAIGISVNIPARSVGFITARSSTSTQGILIHSGIVDPSYSDELRVIISNITEAPIFVDHEKAIAQILLLPNYCPHITESATLKIGRGSFGSSNK